MATASSEKPSRVRPPGVGLGPQEGPQEAFLATPADIAIAGGSAGGGKTAGLLLETTRHVHVPGFYAVIFRRTYPQIMAEGGLWDTSQEFYPYAGGYPVTGDLEWRFPAGSTIRFAHMQREEDRRQWDSSQIPLIAFDQLESFSWKQFSYMFSRNRSGCGVRPYIRGTCNPDPDCFLREFLRWWIDDETGYAIPERSGVLRWFIMRGNEPEWADSPATLKERFGPLVMPKSVTFIPSTVEDNKILMERNPEYVGNLELLPYVDRMRLRGVHGKGGNWNVRETAGTLFKREWFQIVDAAPAGADIRYWDRAATAATDGVEVKGASFTAGARVRKCPDGRFYLIDMVRGQYSDLGVEKTLSATASQDGREVSIGIEGDPGQSGIVEARMQARKLAGYNVKINYVHDPKKVRSKPMRAQIEAGNFLLVRGPWNEAFIRECVDYDGTKDTRSDQVDAASGGFYLQTTAVRIGAWGR